jgi:diaminopimelate decarboxylase
MILHEKVITAGSLRTSPVYVYDLSVLRSQIGRMRALPWTSKRLFFATMANDHPAVLSQVRECGIGVFVNSPKHLRLARSLGFTPENIVYAASNMTREEMRLCLAARIHVVVDSIDQVALLVSEAGPGTALGVRVNVGSALNGNHLTYEPDYRFGVLPDELLEAVRIASGRGARITGVHSYFGTDLMDHNILVEGLQRLCQVGSTLPDLEYVDAGGGFGVPDTLGARRFDLNTYGDRILSVLSAAERALDRRITLFLEPGRFLAATCGVFFVKVVSLKRRAERLFVGTNASVAQFPRALLYPTTARHPWQIVGREQEIDGGTSVWLCGNSTYSRDVLARSEAGPAPRIGDTIVLHHAGAYCRSMQSSFLGKEVAAEIVLDSAAETHIENPDLEQFAVAGGRL